MFAKGDKGCSIKLFRTHPGMFSSSVVYCASYALSTVHGTANVSGIERTVPGGLRLLLLHMCSGRARAPRHCPARPHKYTPPTHGATEPPRARSEAEPTQSGCTPRRRRTGATPHPTPAPNARANAHEELSRPHTHSSRGVARHAHMSRTASSRQRAAR